MTHPSTIRFVNDVTKKLHVALKQANGDLYKAVIAPTSDKSRPKFNDDSEIYWGGLTIAVNDVWVFDVDVVEYHLYANKTYTVKLRLTPYDHFGFELPDLQKAYVFFAGFRAWFILQHIKGFKPFIVRMVNNYAFRGTI